MAFDAAAAHEAPGGLVWALDLPGWRWTHYDLVHSASLGAIRAEGWEPSVLSLMQDKDETPRLTGTGELVTGLLPDFAQGSALDDRLTASWRFAMRPDRIVTARRSPIHGLFHAWSCAQDGAPPAGPGALVDQVLSHFAAEVERRAEALDARARAIEDELLSEASRQPLDGLGRTLGALRRDATRLQRLAGPVARLVREGAENLPAWAAAESHDAARRRVTAALDDLRALQEHGRSLQDELSARQAAETNRNVNTLSVLTAVLLPPTLVSGFFGMNTDGLPFKDDWHGTLWAAGLMAASVAGTLALLRARRIL